MGINETIVATHEGQVFKLDVKQGQRTILIHKSKTDVNWLPSAYIAPTTAEKTKSLLLKLYGGEAFVLPATVETPA